MAIIFDKLAQLIIVEAPDTEITIQELVDAIREWEDELSSMDIARVADASGKEDLGGGTLVGVTLLLIDWKIQFEARPGPAWVLCSVTGGNLVSVDDIGDSQNAIEPSAYVTVNTTASSSATLLENEGASADEIWNADLNLYTIDESAGETLLQIQTEGTGGGSGLSPETIAMLEAMQATGWAQIGQGLGSVHYIDTIIGPGGPIQKAYVKAYEYDAGTADFTEIKGMDSTDAFGEFELFLDPMDYVLRIEKGGAFIRTDIITVVTP